MKRILIRICILILLVLVCALLVFTSIRRLDQSIYASVFFSSPAGVRINLNSKNKIVSVRGTNDKGRSLIEKISLKNTEFPAFIGLILEQSLDNGYLADGGYISVIFDTEDDQWLEKNSEEISTYIKEYLGERLTYTLDVGRKYTTSPPTTPPLPPYPTSATAPSSPGV